MIQEIVQRLLVDMFKLLTQHRCKKDRVLPLINLISRVDQYPATIIVLTCNQWITLVILSLVDASILKIDLTKALLEP